MDETFAEYLKNQNLSQNTIRSYLYALKQYNNKYDSLTPGNLRDYKVFLIETYKPQTVNLRIRAINCYLESLEKGKRKLTTVKVQQKPFLENVISEADYLYFKNCLWRDHESTGISWSVFWLPPAPASVSWCRSKWSMSKSVIWISTPKAASCAGSIFPLPCRRRLSPG